MQDRRLTVYEKLKREVKLVQDGDNIRFTPPSLETTLEASRILAKMLLKPFYTIDRAIEELGFPPSTLKSEDISLLHRTNIFEIYKATVTWYCAIQLYDYFLR